jgi:putative ABC transport system permease protein
MNIKALLNAMALRKFATTLLLIQLALTLGLVVNTLLLALDTREKLNQPLGFNAQNLLIVSLKPTSAQFQDESYYLSVLQQDMAKLGALDGVNSVAHYNQLPLQNGGWSRNLFDVNFPDDGIGPEALTSVPLFYSSANGLENLGIELVQGRGLTAADDTTPAKNPLQKNLSSDEKSSAQDERNIIVTQSLADAIYPDGAALGQLTTDGRIVGIAKDFLVRPNKIGPARYFAYFSNFTTTRPDISKNYVLNLSPGAINKVKAQIESTLLAVQPERAIGRIYSMPERLARLFRQESGLANLFSVLCVLMLLVTVVSSFAHAHFHVSQQRKYIGIRRALGARKIDIMLYVFSENWLISLFSSILGIVAVIVINLGLSQVIAIEKPDILLFIGAALVVFISGTLATWLPAYKTTEISPVVATQTL